MKNLTLENIARACSSELKNAGGNETREITCAVIDSRKIEEGGLFLPLREKRWTDTVSSVRCLKKERHVWLPA